MISCLLKGYKGLSETIFTQIYLAVYGDDSTSLILLVAWLSALIPVSVMYTIGEKEVKIRQPNENKVFYYFLYLSDILVVYLMAVTLIKKNVTFFRVANSKSAVALCVFFFLLVVVTFRRGIFLWKQMKASPSTVIVEQEQNTSTNQAEEETNTFFFVDIFNKPKRGEDYGILQALLSIDMLIIFVATLVRLGSGLTASDNMGKIGYEPKSSKSS